MTVWRVLDGEGRTIQTYDPEPAAGDEPDDGESICAFALDLSRGSDEVVTVETINGARYRTFKADGVWQCTVEDDDNGGSQEG